MCIHISRKTNPFQSQTSGPRLEGGRGRRLILDFTSLDKEHGRDGAERIDLDPEEMIIGGVIGWAAWEGDCWGLLSK